MIREIIVTNKPQSSYTFISPENRCLPLKPIVLLSQTCCVLVLNISEAQHSQYDRTLSSHEKNQCFR